MNQLELPLPRARVTDPLTAAAAARDVEPGNTALVAAIRSYVYRYGPATAFEIADALAGRWQHDTIRSACARARLDRNVGAGLSPGGRPCCLYFLHTDVVTVSADRL